MRFDNRPTAITEEETFISRNSVLKLINQREILKRQFHKGRPAFLFT